jgi:hypothetical protein
MPVCFQSKRVGFVRQTETKFIKEETFGMWAGISNKIYNESLLMILLAVGSARRSAANKT